MSNEYYQLLSSGLYETKKFSQDSLMVINGLFTESFSYDCYCPDCARESVFVKITEPTQKSIGSNYTRLDLTDTLPYKQSVFKILTFSCTRNPVHGISFFFMLYRIEKYTIEITKVGQYPSVADLSNSDTKKYQKVLGHADNHELNKAIGLFAHGVGIGSFVYLRRIFENLIEEAHQQALQSPEWDNTEYVSSRMNEKISLLQDHLPNFLVENRILYSILSKGIHELSEVECREAFPAVRIAIELILDEKIKKLEETQKRSVAKQSLEQLHARYK